jgi:hypothetical protein
MADFAKTEYPTEREVAKLNSMLGSVGLVQPFNWNKWNAPRIEFHEMWFLTLEDCIKFVTRIVRADRTSEGILWGALHAGALTILCTVAHERAAGEPIPSVKDLTNSPTSLCEKCLRPTLAHNPDQNRACSSDEVM